MSEDSPTLEIPVQYTKARDADSLASRALEPIPPELVAFLERRLELARARGAWPSAPAPASLADAVVLPGVPWPADLALLFLHHLAELIDAAATVGVQLAPFSPHCIALDGPYLDVVPDADQHGVDPAYVAPELRDAAATVDARASQYGLATLAIAILRAEDAPARDVPRVRAHGGVGLPGPLPAIDPAALRVLLAARSPDPARRFSTASDFMVALDAAFGQPPSRSAPATAVAESVPWRAPTPPATMGNSRRLMEIGVIVGLAAIVGGGAGAWSARRSDNVSAGVDSMYALRTEQSPTADQGAATGADTRRGRRSVLDAVARWSSSAGSLARGASAAAEPADVQSAAGRDVTDDIGPPSRTDRARRGEAVREAKQSQPSSAARTGLPALVNAVVVPIVDPVDHVARDLRRRLVDSGGFAAGGLRTASPDSERADPNPSRESVSSPPIERAAPSLVSDAGLRYPPSLHVRRLAGQVVARFVVDSVGRVDPASFELVRSTNPGFTREVRAALRSLRYLPAERGGRPVAQTVEQTFDFAPPPPPA